MSEKALSQFMPLDCNHAASLLTGWLSALGLSVVRSFDLQATRSVQENRCVCPHHGTAHCTCQWIVLLVYGTQAESLTLVLDGQENHSWLNVVDQPGQTADLHLAKMIFETVEAEMGNLVGMDPDCQLGDPLSEG